MLKKIFAFLVCFLVILIVVTILLPEKPANLQTENQNQQQWQIFLIKEKPDYSPDFFKEADYEEWFLIWKSEESDYLPEEPSGEIVDERFYYQLPNGEQQDLTEQEITALNLERKITLN